MNPTLAITDSKTRYHQAPYTHCTSRDAEIGVIAATLFIFISLVASSVAIGMERPHLFYGLFFGATLLAPLPVGLTAAGCSYAIRRLCHCGSAQGQTEAGQQVAAPRISEV